MNETPTPPPPAAPAPPPRPSSRKSRSLSSEAVQAILGRTFTRLYACCTKSRIVVDEGENEADEDVDLVAQMDTYTFGEFYTTFFPNDQDDVKFDVDQFYQNFFDQFVRAFSCTHPQPLSATEEPQKRSVEVNDGCERCASASWEYTGSWIAWQLACNFIPIYGLPNIEVIAAIIERTIGRNIENDQEDISKTVSGDRNSIRIAALLFCILIFSCTHDQLFTVVDERMVRFLLLTIEWFDRGHGTLQAAIFAMQALTVLDISTSLTLTAQLKRLCHRTLIKLAPTNARRQIEKRQNVATRSKLSQLKYLALWIEWRRDPARFHRRSLPFDCNWRDRSWQNAHSPGTIWLLGTYPATTIYQLAVSLRSMLEEASSTRTREVDRMPPSGYLYLEIRLLTRGSAKIALVSELKRTESLRLDPEIFIDENQWNIVNDPDTVCFDPFLRRLYEPAPNGSANSAVIEHKIDRKFWSQFAADHGDDVQIGGTVGMLIDIRRSRVKFTYENVPVCPVDRAGNSSWLTCKPFAETDYYVTISLETFQQVEVELGFDRTRWKFAPTDKIIANFIY